MLLLGKLIYDSNVIINRIVDVEYASEAEKNKHIAEAKFFRGYAFKLLANLYGGVPIVLDEITGVKLDFVRATREEVYLGLKKHKADGAMKKVSKASGRHVDTVRLVLKGKYQDDYLLEIAKLVLIELNALHQERLDNVKKVVRATPVRKKYTKKTKKMVAQDG